MIDENNSEIFSFGSRLNSDGDFDIPKDKMKIFYDKGYSDIKVIIFADSKKAAVENGYQLEMFEKIKSIQSLPDSAVLNFLLSKGSLKK